MAVLLAMENFASLATALAVSLKLSSINHHPSIFMVVEHVQNPHPVRVNFGLNAMHQRTAAHVLHLFKHFQRFYLKIRSAGGVFAVLRKRKFH